MTTYSSNFALNEREKITQTLPRAGNSSSSKGQSAKTADWLVDNDVLWPVLRNCACANLGKLKIEHGG